MKATAGRRDVNTLWKSPESQYKPKKGGSDNCEGDAECERDQLENERLQCRHDALLVGPWKPPEKAEKPPEKWKLLTPNDSFFLVGARYCLFAYQTRETKTNAPILAAVKEWEKTYATCPASDDASTCYKNADDALKKAAHRRRLRPQRR